MLSPPRCWLPTPLLIAFALGGCATVNSGAYGVSVDEQGRPLPQSGPGEPRVSAGELTDLSSPHFGALEVTFENRGHEWIRIHGVELDFGSQSVNENMFVPAGPDLDSWREATSMRNAIREVNQETTLELIALGAVALTAFSGRGSPGAVVGGTAAIASLTALTARQVAGVVQESERVKLFPSSHLLGGPFGVPPGLFVKRWVVLNSRGPASSQCVRWLELKFMTESSGPRRVRLTVDRAGSEWQRPACGSLRPQAAQRTTSTTTPWNNQ